MFKPLWINKRDSTNRIHQTRNRLHPVKCETILMLLLVITSVVMYPVAGNQLNYNIMDEILVSEDILYHPNENKVFIPNYDEDNISAIAQEWPNLTLAERKLTPRFVYLINLEESSKNLSEYQFVKQMMLGNILKHAPDITPEGISSEQSPYILFLVIRLFPGNSTSILDPYVYNVYTRSENNSQIEAWVEVSKIKEIANLSEVMKIYPVIYPSLNVGSAETEGNTTLHTKEILELPENPDGNGISVGIISDGMDNVSEAVNSGDLPNSVLRLSVGGGNEGTAMAEIIQDIAPNASLFLPSG